MHFRRNLDPNERMIFLCDKVSPFNVVFVLGISGVISRDACRNALDEVQKFHALLGVRVGRSQGGEFEFIFDSALKIPLVTLVDVPSSLESCIEEQMNFRFDPLAGPLIRCVLIRHGSGLSTVLFVMHHSITDGMSCCVLAKDFMTLLEGGGPGGRPAIFSDPIIPDPINRRLPVRFRGIGGAFLHVKAIVMSKISIMKRGRPEPHVFCDADLEHRRSMIALRSIDEMHARNMMNACHANKCSVQGALGAAFLLAAKKHLCSRDNNPLALQLLTPVNIRGELKPAVGDELGLYVATQATTHRLIEREDFWRLAREISSDLKKHLKAGSPLAFAPLASKYVVKLVEIGGRFLDPVRISKWLCSRFPPSMALSNLGVVDIGANDGAIKLNSLKVLGSLSGFGAISSFLLTFNGRLEWSFVAMFPSLERSHLDRVADESVRYLLSHTSGALQIQ